MPAKLQLFLTREWIGGAIGAALAVVTGLVLLFTVAGDGLTRLSYDLPFAGRNLAPTGAVIVLIDEVAQKVLKQDPCDWDRTLHAQLVERLTAGGAKAVVFDIVFARPKIGDAAFATAIKSNGAVVLGANYAVNTRGAISSSLDLPTAALRDAAAAWGSVTLLPDPDNGVRMACPSTKELPTLAWQAARIAGADLTKVPADSKQLWINYYGPPGAIRSVRYEQALLPDGVTPDFFRGKVVFIGAKQAIGFLDQAREQFETPFTFWNRPSAPGVEIHTTAFLNLMDDQWKLRSPLPWELSLLLLAAIGCGFLFARVRPFTASILCVTVVLAVALLDWVMFLRTHYWFAWLIPPVTAVVALGWATLFHSLHWYIERGSLIKSLELHLSPQRARQVLRDPKLLRPGGELAEVTIMFTDITNFSKISGEMTTDDVFALLNKYFESCLGCIHETEGTVIKLLGDGIYAIWNAPLRQKDHRARACGAGLHLQERLVQFDATERSLPLRTRVGLHTGIANVGNVGSSARFDYTAIGDCVNIASRLEGLNKFLGTGVLATRDTQTAVENTLVSRLAGHFRFKGVAKVVQVHEIIGKIDQLESTARWRESFAQGLYHFQRKAFDEAEAGFQRTLQLRGGDGVSQFYLEQIQELRGRELPADWNGEIALKEK